MRGSIAGKPQSAAENPKIKNTRHFSDNGRPIPLISMRLCLQFAFS